MRGKYHKMSEKNETRMEWKLESRIFLKFGYIKCEGRYLVNPWAEMIEASHVCLEGISLTHVIGLRNIQFSNK